VLPLEAAGAAVGLTLATRLRDAGLTVALEPVGRSLKALLRAADKRGARLAVILGEEELRAGKATVRHLVRREDVRDAFPLDAPREDLAARVRALLGGDA
jgi:histidyl-tRNA synthetase